MLPNVLALSHCLCSDTVPNFFVADPNDLGSEMSLCHRSTVSEWVKELSWWTLYLSSYIVSNDMVNKSTFSKDNLPWISSEDSIIFDMSFNLYMCIIVALWVLVSLRSDMEIFDESWVGMPIDMRVKNLMWDALMFHVNVWVSFNQEKVSWYAMWVMVVLGTC